MSRWPARSTSRRCITSRCSNSSPGIRCPHRRRFAQPRLPAGLPGMTDDQGVHVIEALRPSWLRRGPPWEAGRGHRREWLHRLPRRGPAGRGGTRGHAHRPPRAAPPRGVGFEDVDLLDLSSVLAVTRGVDTCSIWRGRERQLRVQYPSTLRTERHGHGQRPRGGAYQRVGRVTWRRAYGYTTGRRTGSGGRVGALLPERRRPPVHLHEDRRRDAVPQLPSLYGVPFTVLRYGIPYGPRMREELLIPLFIKKALAGEPLTVAGREPVRRFVYVRDLRGARARHERPSRAPDLQPRGPAEVHGARGRGGIRRSSASTSRSTSSPSGRATSLAARCAPTRRATSSAGPRGDFEDGLAIRSSGSARSGAGRSPTATSESATATATARGPRAPPTSRRRARGGARTMAARPPPTPRTGAAGA